MPNTNNSINNSPIPFTEVTVDTNLVANNGYTPNALNRITFSLPATVAQGVIFRISGKGSGGFLVAPNIGQTLYSAGTTIAYPNVYQSSSAHDCIEIICITANSEFDVRAVNGTFASAYYTRFSNGSGHTAYLKADGSAWTVGANESGQLGNQTITTFSSPIAVVGSHSFIEISAGASSTFGLKSDGTLWAWGLNGNGELGINSIANQSSPVLVVGNHSFIHVYTPNYGGVSNTTFALKADGSAWSWGKNNSGQLGDGTRTDRSSPVQVLGNHSFIQLAGWSYWNGGGLKADGSVWVWGYGGFGNLAQGTNTNSFSSPVQVIGNHSFVEICSETAALLARKADGSVWAWGLNSTGGLGDQSTTNRSSPVQVVGNHSFIQIRGGADECAFALKSNGEIWTWGKNTAGSLGTNTATHYSSPVLVVGGFNFFKLRTKAGDAAGNNFSSAMKSDGNIMGWGLNASGQFGDQTLTNTSSPVSVVGVP